MIYLLVILIVVVCFLLVVAVLVQNPKGGGLGAGFGGVGNQVMGARRATDFIEKATWSLVAGLLVLCLFSGVAIGRRTGPAVEKSAVEDRINNEATPVPQTPAPGGQQPAGPTPAQ